MQNEIKIFCAKDWSANSADESYELLDTGGGEKMERFGPYVFARPCEGALWEKTLPRPEWEKADGKFWSSKSGGKNGWKIRPKDGLLGNTLKDRLLNKWEMSYRGVKFLASPTPFRHLGFFPEQAVHWDFIETRIREALTSENPVRGREGSQRSSASNGIKFLNLFGYTGIASLFALRAGAEVTHLDASKQTLDWAKENQKISGLGKMPMRVIPDDALKFVWREEKRGSKYDCLMIDPPKFGRGPKGEIWKIEEDLPKLLSATRKILSAKPLFVILNSYAADLSPLSLGYALADMMKNFKGTIEPGELCVPEKSNGRKIPLASTAVWRAMPAGSLER